MANPFEVRVPNALEALMAGQQGYGEVSSAIKQRQVSAAREQAAQSMMQGGDSRSAIATLMGIGDIQGAQTLAGLENNNRDFQFRTQESQRSQSNADRAFGLQKQQAEEAARGFDYREIDDGAGGKVLARVNRATGQAEKVDVAGVQNTPNNPYLPAGQMNESQSKDALYANRMLSSEKVLRDVETAGTSWWERRRGDISDKTGINVRGSEYQKFDQAQRDFINATLRRESGAVIATSEFDNANKQYFPMPGDTKEIIAQKRANRAEAIRGIAAGGGKGYRPESVISQSGEISPNPAVRQAPALPAQSTARKQAPPEIIQEAKAAIAQGADKVAVRKRLVEQGYNPAGL